MNWRKNRIRSKLLNEQRSEAQLLKEEIQKAHHDWVTAQYMFDNVVDPDEIDHIIYLMNAAEIKYMTLYKRAKQYYKFQQDSLRSDVT